MDRYNRLKNLKEFGYNIDWSVLRSKKVAVIGVGGLGSISSDMICRFGVAELYLFDFDNVNPENLNRLFFKPEHIGKSKVEVVSEVLGKINPDVKIFPFHGDIMRSEFEEKFESILNNVDIILQGLDNATARQYLNVKCVKLNKAYIDAGASRSGLGGYVHPIIPYKTACSSCIATIKLKQNNENAEPCTASLPSTMAILASMQVQEMLKFFFNFAPLGDYLTYNGLTNIIKEYHTQRDPNCPICGEKQNDEDYEEILDNELNEEKLQSELKELAKLNEKEKEKD